jgi:hypothetical protein
MHILTFFFSLASSSSVGLYKGENLPIKGTDQQGLFRQKLDSFDLKIKEGGPEFFWKIPPVPHPLTAP